MLKSARKHASYDAIINSVAREQMMLKFWSASCFSLQHVCVNMRSSRTFQHVLSDMWGKNVDTNMSFPSHRVHVGNSIWTHAFGTIQTCVHMLNSTREHCMLFCEIFVLSQRKWYSRVRELIFTARENSHLIFWLAIKHKNCLGILPTNKFR